MCTACFTSEHIWYSIIRFYTTARIYSVCSSFCSIHNLNFKHFKTVPILYVHFSEHAYKWRGTQWHKKVPMFTI